MHVPSDSSNRTRDGRAAGALGDGVNGGGELMTKTSVSETEPPVPGNYPMGRRGDQ